MPYNQIYTEDDFLNAMPLNTPITQNSITRLVGCSVPTTKKYLKQLEATGQVRQMNVIGSYNVNWERII
jgi:predicted transcriptional regulator